MSKKYLHSGIIIGVGIYFLILGIFTLSREPLGAALTLFAGGGILLLGVFLIFYEWRERGTNEA